ncbi:kinase-like domain-containing protein [Phycomyces blakesleeanus]|uniref:Kinase-like domain-containing protein n=1 Tax=Phycomyces blakesleeanus TaxID=4837 RepID=A0ABR3B813_PHYBL
MHAHSRAPPSSIFSYNAENLLEESFTENTQSTSIEDDVYYIVEPQNGGILYLYGNGKPLEKIPLSVKEIVTHSPWRTPDGTTYIGGKNTVMIAIDPRNGNILRKFDLDQSEEAYVMATQKKLPPHTIFLGRDEYRVAIFNNDNEKWWNVTYAEYVTNQLDTDVPASTPPMDVYLAPDADNAITAIHLPTGELMWTMPTGFPAVRVFDVYRRPDFTIALFEQEPPQTLDKGIMGDMLKLSQNNPGLTTAYVGLHYGGLYALSTDRFPLAQLSLWASLYTGIEPGKKQPLIGGPAANKRPASKCCKGCKNHAECLVGKHIIETPLLPAKPSPLGIMGPIVVEPAEPLSPGTKLYKEQKKGFFYDGPGMFWKSYLLALVIAAYVYRVQIERFSRAQVLPRWNRFVKKWNSRIKKYKASVAKSRELANDKDTEKQKDMSQETDKDMGAKVDELMAMVNALNKEAKETKKANEAKEANEKREKAEKEKKEKEKELLAIAIETSNATGLNLKSFTPTTTSVLTLSKTVLGYGSHGTVVYKGEFDGRSVAVKRLLIDFYDVALQEVKLLQESDDHANVIRYFYKEETDRFLFIALELCYGSLHDCMERSLPIADMQLFDQINPANILQQMMAGIQHLHSLKIVHRDIKPHNILLAPSKTNRKDKKPSLRILISDFGLCKKLDGEQSSFHYTAQSPAGTSGWRAPELLAGALHATASETSHSSKGGNDPNTIGSVKATRAIDIFSAGCVFYYVLSGGEHPFGNRFGRENNILKGVYDLSRLQSMGEDGVEAMDLIERMLSVQPHIR